MRTLLALCGGFLMAVVWMDLMFDVEVIRAKSKLLPEKTLTLLSGFYRQITTDADPLRYLITAVMLLLGAGLAWDLFTGVTPLWYRLVSLALAVVPTVMARVRTLKNGIRMGRAEGSPEERSALAHALSFDHILAFAMMTLFSLWQLFGAIYFE